MLALIVLAVLAYLVVIIPTAVCVGQLLRRRSLQHERFETTP